MPKIMNRTAFLIDGFNLYHSVKNASVDLGLGGAGTRWLDIKAMCASYLHVIGGDAQVAEVYYFSALAEHRKAVKQDTITRHLGYAECLKATGVTVELARFKKKWIKCDHCKQRIKRYEEKETDVAVATKLLEIFFRDECDTAAIVTGDTDIVPAVKTARRLFPHKSVVLLLPYKRHNQELAQLTPKHIKISKETYTRHQFPDPFTAPDGRTLLKPVKW